MEEQVLDAGEEDIQVREAARFKSAIKPWWITALILFGIRLLIELSTLSVMALGSGIGGYSIGLIIGQLIALPLVSLIIALPLALIPINKFVYWRKLLQVGLITYIVLVILTFIGKVLSYLVTLGSAG